MVVAVLSKSENQRNLVKHTSPLGIPQLSAPLTYTLMCSTRPTEPNPSQFGSGLLGIAAFGFAWVNERFQ